MLMNDSDRLQIGAILFPQMDQADFTGPFEVLARLPNSQFHILAKERTPTRDAKNLILTPEETLTDAPQLDLLLVPGGTGVNALMEDEEVLNFIRRQAAQAKLVLSICTGALVLGAAGLLKGRRATTHWASHHLLAYFSAIPQDARVVVDGNLVTTAGVTAGLDGALRVASLLRGEQVARQIQLYLQYAPEPPFDCGNPQMAAPDVLHAAKAAIQELMNQRTEVVIRVSKRLNVTES
jgi:cyclohexyl-isocyanide hydratase